MFPSAIRELLSSLNGIPEWERSPYDRALQRELQALLYLATNLRQVGASIHPRSPGSFDYDPSADYGPSAEFPEPESFTPRTVRQQLGIAAVQTIGKVTGLTMFTVDTRQFANLRGVFTIDPDDGTPDRKWTSCPKADCPNKKL